LGKGTRYGRYLAVFALIVLVAITLNRELSPGGGARGIPVGETVPPFAAPLALGGLPGDVDIATHANDGSAGRVAACAERGPLILNVCQLYEHAPVVLALFVNESSCPATLSVMQKLTVSFPDVRFAAVAIKGETGGVGRLIHSHGLSFPVGLDRDGSLVALYQLATCPQVSFIYPGGLVQSLALLSTPTLAQLRGRVAELLAASRARGWKPGKA
jgi:hypothetical protein